MTDAEMHIFWKGQGEAGLKPWEMESRAWMMFEDNVMSKDMYFMYTVPPDESPSGGWLHTQEAGVFRLRQADPAFVPDDIWQKYQARWKARKGQTDRDSDGPQLNLFGDVA